VLACNSFGEKRGSAGLKDSGDSIYGRETKRTNPVEGKGRKKPSSEKQGIEESLSVRKKRPNNPF